MQNTAMKTFGRDNDRFYSEYVQILENSDVDGARQLLNEICAITDDEQRNSLSNLVADIDDFISDMELDECEMEA